MITEKGNQSLGPEIRENAYQGQSTETEPDELNDSLVFVQEYIELDCENTAAFQNSLTNVKPNIHAEVAVPNTMMNMPVPVNVKLETIFGSNGDVSIMADIKPIGQVEEVSLAPNAMLAVPPPSTLKADFHGSSVCSSKEQSKLLQNFS